MMNFDEFVRNLNKANKEIEKLTAETNAMQEDIVNEEQRKLDAFMAKLKPMMNVFYSGKTPFKTMRLKTGIYSLGVTEITIDLSVNSFVPSIGKKEGRTGYAGPYLIDIKHIKEKDSWDYYSCLLKLLDNTDVVVSNLEQDFARQVTEDVDKKFMEAAKKNDMVAAEWRKTCVSNKPFYTESWNDSDIIAALERAGKTTTKKNIDELKAKFIVHLQMDGVVIRNELLDDLAKGVDA